MRRLLLISLLLLSTSSWAGPETGLDENTRILHALNRLGYGPRPGDLERVREIGLEVYIHAQLHPEQIEDPAVERRLSAYNTLWLDPIELMRAYPPPAMLQAIGKQLTRRGGMNPESVARIFPELERIENRKEAAEAETERAPQGPAERMRRMMDSPVRIGVELSQAKLIRAVYDERQLQEVMTDFWFNHFNVYAGKGSDRFFVSSYERDAIRPHALGNFRELLRAVARHPAMLFYLDNWLSAAPDANFDRRLAERYASEAVRELGLPPGGLVTLILRDRGMDTGWIERAMVQRERAARRGYVRRTDDEIQRPRNGLNENYARELLELHTLGVDGGYTQRDIVEVARCFTGWTLQGPQAGQQFVYMKELHDRGAKVVLGHEIKGGGMAEGEAVLDLLANHSSTARFVSTKLAIRFVGDDPPASLVERMAESFLASDGEIRAVMRTMLDSDEFWSPDAVKTKIKTPFEFVVSLLRATDAELSDLPGVGDASGREMPGTIKALRDMGQPLYAAQPPTGYGDTAAAWVSTGALLNRFKVGFAVAANRLPGVRVEAPPAPRDQPTADYLCELGRELIGQVPSSSTLASLEQQIGLPPEELERLGIPARFASSPEARSRLALAWLAASPEFQRK